MTLDQFYQGHEASARLFSAARAAIAEVGPADVRVTTSQIAFRRRAGSAFAWMPNMYRRKGGVPLVLTIGLRRRDDSPRWKEVVEPAPGCFTHHLELRSEADIDDEVLAWLREAWEQAV